MGANWKFEVIVGTGFDAEGNAISSKAKHAIFSGAFRAIPLLAGGAMIVARLSRKQATFG
jgi:hypothetical protein